jgi:hypothetical protein
MSDLCGNRCYADFREYPFHALRWIRPKGSEEGSAIPAPMRQREIDFEDRSIRYSSLRGGCGRVGFFRPVVLVA